METDNSRNRKTCPICKRDLDADADFGISRASKDGRNHYCKVCIREKATKGRRAVNEYRLKLKEQKKRETVLLKQDFTRTNLAQSRVSPVGKVQRAIKRGARTQRDIARETKLSRDEIGDALAKLLLWMKEIRTETIDDVRQYFPVEPESGKPVESKPTKTAQTGFSSFTRLMPLRAMSVDR